MHQFWTESCSGVHTGLILFRNPASHHLHGEKPTTILPPSHDHVLIESAQGGGGGGGSVASLAVGSVANELARERERESESGGKVGLSESM